MTDTVLIVGAGLAGLRAAWHCSEAGARALVLERAPIAGGHLAASLSGTDAAPPTVADIAANENIEVVTLAGLGAVQGRPGSFEVTYRERARFVTDACTRCNHCRAACPVVVPNQFDAGLTYRKAVYAPLADDSLPGAYVIDVDSCLNTPPNYLPCDRCVQVCDDDAIHFEMSLVEQRRRNVGAIVVAGGFELTPDEALVGLGYGAHPDVLTSAELQRLLQAPGPSGGFACRPSDESYPERVLLVLDDLSDFGLYIVSSQAQKLIDQGVTVVDALLLSAPANEERVAAMAREAGFGLRWGGMFRVDPDSDAAPRVRFEDFVARRHVDEHYDLVVLGGDPRPPAGLAELANVVGFELDEHGYVARPGDGPDTTREGVYVAGCVSGPARIDETLAQSRAAAGAALADLNPRLLKPGYATAGDEEDTVPPKDDALRQRIERMLTTLLDAR